MISRSSAVTLFGATLLTASLATPAQANERNVFRDCALDGRVEFSVDWERNKVDFDFDIDGVAPREKWQVEIIRNSRTLIDRSYRSDEDGDLSREFVRRGKIAANERWTFEATNGSGNSCQATVRF